jgi:hypothetical protein
MLKLSQSIQFTPQNAKRFVLTLAFVALCCGILSARAQEETAEATEAPVMVQPTNGELYVPMTFPLVVDPTLYTNPFDTNDIEALGIFQSPTGRQFVISGFWMQPYEDVCEQPCTVEDLQPIGDPTWQIRFTPQEVGEWSYTLQVRDGVNLLPVIEGTFEAAPSDEQGFIRVGVNKRYFQYQNGEPYFPIGHNLKWSWEGGGGLYAYREWLQELSESGGNYARLYIDVPWFISLEWTAPVGDYRSAQIEAARLDTILDMAAEYGIALQLVLLWHQGLTVYNGPPVNVPDTFARPDMNADWDNNPYSLIYGGPIGGPSVFFYDAEARALFQRRLQYIVARWGYSPQIFAWELIDEIDRTANYDPQITGQWLTDNASYLRQIDQQGHLITAGSADYQASVATNPLLDFTSAQFYQRRPIETVGDQTTLAVNAVRRNLEANAIPDLVTAYSLSPWFEPTAEDPQGIHFQSTLWASVFAGAGGGAASDWWDTYIVLQGLAQYYSPLSAFVIGVDWPNLNLQPAEAGLVTDDLSAYLPVRISNFNRQFSLTPSDVVPRTITPDGVFPDISSQSSYLYGQTYNTQLSQAQIYSVTTPASSYLEIAVRRVSPQAVARLHVTVDGQNAIDLSLSPDSSNLAVRVPLSVGSHEIILDNMGEDWLELEYVEVGQLLAPARVLTLRDTTAGIALAWLQHRDYTWEKVAAGVERQSVLFRYQLDQMPPGRYDVEIWNPLTGAVLGEELVRVGENGILSVELLPMDSQLALRIFRQADPATATPAPTDIPLILTETPVATLTSTSIPISRTPRPNNTPDETDEPLIVQTNTLRPESTP